MLHELRGLPPPIAMDNSNNNVHRLIANLEKEEDVAKCRNPITKQMVIDMIQEGCKTKITSKEALVTDITIIAHELGPRAAEIVQTKTSAPDMHEYPSGKK